MSLVKQTLTVFASRILTLVIAAVGLIYFTQTLGAELFGSFVLFRTLVVLLSIFVDLGINDAIEKRISEGSSGEIIGAAFLLKLVPVGLLGAGIYVSQSQINEYLGTDVALLLIPVIFADQFGRQYAAALRGEQRVGLAEIGQTIQGVLFTLVGILLVFLDWGVIGLVLALFLSWAVFSIWLLVKTDTGIALPAWETISSVVSFAKYNFVASLVGHRSYNWMDTFVIGLLMSPTFVAGYEVAWRVTKLATLLSKSIGKTLFPQVSEWDADESKDEIERILPDVFLAAVLFVIPAIFGIALLGEEIIGLVFGSEYAFAAGAALILMISKIFDSLNDIVSRVLLGLNQPDVIARAVVVFVTVNVVANFVLVYYFGIVGAAVATSLAIATLVGILLYRLREELSITFKVSRFAIVLAASVGMAIVVWSTSRVIPVDSIPVLGSVIALAIGTYLGFLTLSTDFRLQLRSLWGEF